MTARPFQPTLTATTDNQGNCVWTQPGASGAGDGYQCVASIPAAVGGTFVAQVAGGVSFPPWSGSQPYGPITYQAMQTLTITASGLLPNTTYFCILIGFIDRIENIDWSLPTATGTTQVTSSDAITMLVGYTLAAGAVIYPGTDGIASATPQYFPCTSFAALRLSAHVSAGGPLLVECFWYNQDLTATMGYRRFILGSDNGQTLEVVIPHLGDMLSIKVSNQSGGSLLTADNFNRANGLIGSTNGAGTLDPLPWNARVGTWNVIGNQAGITDLLPTRRIVTLPLGNANVDLSITQSAFDINGQGIILRYVDANNYLALLGTINSTMNFVKVEAGVQTNISPAVGLLSAGDTLRVTAVGSALTGYLNGVAIAFATSTFNQSATNHGLLAHSTGLRYDNWSASGYNPVTFDLCATHHTQPVSMWGGLDITTSVATNIPAGTTVVMIAPLYIFGGAAILSFNPSGAAAGFVMRAEVQQADGSWNTIEVYTQADGGRLLLPFFIPSQPIRISATNNTAADHAMDADLMYDLHAAG